MTLPPEQSEALLACPFCGGEGRLYSVSFPMIADVSDVGVSCSDCDTVGPSMMYEYGVHSADDLPGIEASAIAAWNERVPARSLALQPGGEK